MTYLDFDLTMAIAALDLVLGVTVFIICFCRAVVSTKDVLRRVRLKFTLLGPAALAFGVSPLWGDWPGIINPILLLAIVVGLLAESFQWKSGPPASVKPDTMPDELKDNL